MQQLGDLEAAVMDVIWRTDEPVRVREVLAGLGDERPLAYTTVMTVMDNVHRKGWLQRERRGRAYWYVPTRTRAEAAADELRAVLDAADNPDGVLLQFVRGVSEAESKALRRGLRARGRHG
ncbi:BlaI/MecI/CopY family transcriptional regulator [Nocardia africana]|uniref:Transcriptional regulator BlaI n=1 Tax=Nocardia africana TaxID=134964 RepID=A0A378X4A2_9NOCA|nr:BlaI/MecI/CopY family transcriptional regulator [Nocardia africana]SUA47471.1 Transcriptional regulator BlaI [Nocardia africana]